MKIRRLCGSKLFIRKSPGLLSIIIDYLEKANVFIMLGHQDNISQKTGEYSVFSKLTRNIDPEHLARKIRGPEVVSDVEYGISKYGMIHSVDFPLTLAGFRGVITRALTIVDVIKNLVENVPDAEGLLTISGLKEGVDVSKYLKSIMPINENNYVGVGKKL
jgi:hypothetical protein